MQHSSSDDSVVRPSSFWPTTDGPERSKQLLHSWCSMTHFFRLASATDMLEESLKRPMIQALAISGGICTNAIVILGRTSRFPAVAIRLEEQAIDRRCSIAGCNGVCKGVVDTGQLKRSKRTSIDNTKRSVADRYSCRLSRSFVHHRS